MMRVDREAAHADRIRLDDVDLHVALRHDVLAAHAPRFADIELGREIAGRDEFISGEAPLLDLVAQRRGNRRVVGEEIEETEIVAAMRLDDAYPLGPAGGGITIALAEIVGRD